MTLANLNLPTGDRLFTGILAGCDLLDASGHLYNYFAGRRRAVLTGARVFAASTRLKIRAPKLDGFKCPEWPQCGCPGGTTRPECPAVQQKNAEHA